MVFLILLILFSSTSNQNECNELTMEEALEQADFVFQGIAGTTYQVENKEFVSIGILEMFKSNWQIGFESIPIQVNCNNSCSFCPERLKTYLIYGKADSFKEGFYVSQVLRLKQTGNQLTDLDFLSRIDCLIVDSDSKGACSRHLAPVCGCDGITYGNACSAGQAGVTRWKDGECR
ncbi:MAG: Kazal-type serine protease inhibitor [Ekhidna sp.]